MTPPTSAPALRPNKGFHPILDAEQPYLFIDACMQAWPDADFASAHRHGVTAYGVTSWRPHATLDEALGGQMFWHLVARRHPTIIIAERASDLRRAKAEGKAAFILAAQDGEFVGGELHRIEAFQRLGLRMLIPAYNRANLICDGCLDRTDRGLTRFGELVIDECDRVGIVLDCSHLGRRSAMEIIERSANPVVFSHSNVKAIVDAPRNADDEQIRACAAKGGVIGLAPFGPFVLRNGQTDWPTLDDFIDHVDYVAQLLGSTDSIGIGTDMSLGTYPDHELDPWGEPAYPKSSNNDYSIHVTGDVRSPMRALRDFNSFSHVPVLVDRLIARGYREPDVRRILGENFLRVFSAVWK